MSAEYSTRYIIIIDCLDQYLLAAEIFGQGMSAEQALLLTRIDSENDRVLKGILGHDPGQLHDHGSTGGVVAYTRSAAYANFTEKKLGTLEAGKLADLAVLSKDIFSLPHEEIGTAKVSATMVGGKIVYGKLQ